MGILDILTYPDERLKRLSQEITDFQDPALQTLVDALLQTMNALPYCVGVAAPQTGHAVRLVVIDGQNARKPPTHHHGTVILCNPEILQWSGMEIGREGCLSLPDYTGNVMRAETVTVRFQTRDGQETQLTFSGFEARIVQHEVDHLEGKLFTDRIVSRRADLFSRSSRSSRSST